MRLKACFAAAAAVALLSGVQPALAADKSADKSADAPKSLADEVKGLARQDGLLPVYVDKAKGRVLLQLPAPAADGVSGRFLYVTQLRTGVGSPNMGLDKSTVGQTQVLAFRRIGRKVLVEYENPRFRASGSADEQATAQSSFAYSTVYAGDVIADAPDGGALVDISGFLTRDVLNAGDALKQGDDDAFKIVPELSVADTGAVKVFPENLEFEARETFQSDKPGDEVKNIAPDPKLVSVVVHHSLVKLPDPGYVPRRFDPRTGGFSTQVVDYGTPLGQDVVYEFANRFRLEKTDPGAARSRVKKPIVFYIDRAAPEPIRSALVDGVGWWAKAFEDAGYIDAFRVDVLPEGVDPLDVRYNVVNWIDRATRGWSMGLTVTDPRTGEIVKGSVLLGSLRVRQDMLIFESLVGADKVGTGGPNDPVVAALARIRQLGAHEVGHALGFSHNFAGSTQDRASVMDYPAPRLKLTQGRIDLSDAYGSGVGRWDRFIVDWLYGDVLQGPAGAAALEAKVKAVQGQGLRYVTDSDARADGSPQPWGSLWDDTADPAGELRRMMQVRRVALDNFSQAALRPGEAMANLKRKYVPIYLLHRYQVDAASKLVAGVDYAYALNGDAHAGGDIVPAAEQRAALAALLSTLAPAELDTPERLTPLLSAAWSGSSDRQFDIEVFASAGGAVFDPLVAAETAAGMTIDALIAPTRLNRLVDQHRRDPNALSAEEVLQKLTATVFAPAPGRLAEIQRRVQTRLVIDLARKARDKDSSPAAIALLEGQLSAIAAQLKAAPGGDVAERAHRARLVLLISDRKELERVLDRPKLTPDVPPGMPIGDDGEW